MGLISNSFDNYSKWGALKFTDLFNMPFVNEDKTDGLKWHLQEIRQKTYDALLALENKVDGNSSAINTLAQEIETRFRTIENEIKDIKLTTVITCGDTPIWSKWRRD